MIHTHRWLCMYAEKTGMPFVIEAVGYEGMTLKDQNFIGDSHQSICHPRELQNTVLDPPPAEDLVLVSIKDVHEPASLDRQHDAVVDLLAKLVAKDISEATLAQWLHVSDGNNVKVEIDATKISQNTRPYKI